MQHSSCKCSRPSTKRSNWAAYRNKHQQPRSHIFTLFKHNKFLPLSNMISVATWSFQELGSNPCISILFYFCIISWARAWTETTDGRKPPQMHDRRKYEERRGLFLSNIRGFSAKCHNGPNQEYHLPLLVGTNIDIGIYFYFLGSGTDGNYGQKKTTTEAWLTKIWGATQIVSQKY